MLVLSRTSGQAIAIDDQIKIHVVKISGNRVSIAIDAPREITVLRDEIYQSDKK